MKITAIVGSYRRGGIIESIVDEILDSAKEHGAAVEKINLLDAHVEFCTNCRICTQKEHPVRGRCIQNDDMEGILDRLDESDVFILASPMNFWTVTALMKRFIERLVCYGYWPWGSVSPKNRLTDRTKRAVVVISSAAPGLMARFMTDMGKLLKNVSRLMGAGKVETLYVGCARPTSHAGLRRRTRKKSRALGRKLVIGR